MEEKIIEQIGEQTTEVAVSNAAEVAKKGITVGGVVKGLFIGGLVVNFGVWAVKKVKKVFPKKKVVEEAVVEEAVEAEVTE